MSNESDYKKNQVSGYHDRWTWSRPGDKLSTTMERIWDNIEDILYSNETDFYIAEVISGQYVPPKASSEKAALPFSRTEIYDIGDGKARYAVRVRFVGDMYFRKNLHPWTNALPPVFSKTSKPLTKEEQEWRTSLYPLAYTTDTKQQVPIFGQFVAVRDIGGTYFIDRIINRKAIAGGSWASGRGVRFSKSKRGKKLYKTKGLPRLFIKVPEANNVYRGQKITTIESMKKMRDEYGITTILSLAGDAHDGISDPDFKCRGRGPWDKPSKQGDQDLDDPSVLVRCENAWAKELGMKVVFLPYHGYGKWHKRAHPDWWWPKMKKLNAI